MTLLFYNDDTWVKCVNFTSDNSDSILTSIKMINTYYLMQHVIDTKNMKNGITFYFGCFGTDYYSYQEHDESSSSNYNCRSSVDGTAKTNVKIYSSDLILYGDVDQKFELHFEELLLIQPYIFITGISQQSVFINFDVDMMDDYLSNDIYYLFTTNNINTPSTETLTNGYIVYNICNKYSVQRYGIIKNSTTQTDCSCWVQSNDTSITNDSIFNYPDCNYNSSMFDLKIPDTVNTYSINDLLEWYSIIFTNSNQSIEINEGETLIIDELNINQNEISFNGNVSVKDLTITITGSSFNILNFDDINFDDFENNTALFTLQSTTTDLELLDLKRCKNTIFTLAERCICNYENGNYYNDINEICEKMKTTYCNDLIIKSSEYILNEDEFWNELTFNESLITLNGTSTLTSIICNFEDTTITINGNLYCEIMNINSNTKLIFNGELTINTLVITDTINNLNENGIIGLYGSIEISSIEFLTIQPNCFELISSNQSISQQSINSNYSTLLLLQNHLLRICPLSNLNYEIQCSINTNITEQPFTSIHCNFNDENCLLIVDTDSYYFKNVEFNGIVNISTNSILQTNYINILSLNGYSITLQSFTSNRIIINSIIDDGTLYVESDCDIYSSFIPTIYPYSNVYLLNESITISIVDINIYYKPIIITSNVDIYDIIEIIIDENSDYMYTGLFEIEESTEILQIISTPITSYSNPFVLLKQQSRKLDYDSDIICDNQVIIVNPNDTICDDFNLYDHYCYLTKTNNETYYQNDYITIDYSCPCNISNSNCIFELDKNEVMIYEVNLPLTTLIIHQDVTIKPNYYDFNIQTKNDIDVTFNSINNNVIYVNDESSSFTLNLPLVGNLLLIGYLHKFSQSVTKSVTTTQSLHVSTDYCCKVLLIENESNECIICGTQHNVNGYCLIQIENIDNCQTQKGYGCEVCYEGYESNVTNCNECPNNCLRCYNGECINCDTNYYFNSNECNVINDDSIIIYDNNKTMKCIDGYYSDSNYCIQCNDNCTICDSLQCLTCKESFILNEGSCEYIEKSTGEELVSNYGIIGCEDGYYLNNEQCKSCSLFDNNCNLCSVNECLSCIDGYALLDDGSCSNAIQSTIKDSVPISCYDSGSWYNGIECEECGNNCKNCINGQCILCDDNYILVRSNTCIKNETGVMPDYCLDLTFRGTCKRCEDGYYVNNYNFCEKCPYECTSCYNSTYCFECIDNYVINYYNECIDKSKALENCYQFIPGGTGGCAICNDGYYRLKTTCFKCINNCTTCHNDYECTICNDNYFVSTNLTECISYDELTNCETKTSSGCFECNDNYYLEGQYCNSCESKTPNCESCNKRNGECSTCLEEYVLVNSDCINYQLIDNCKEATNSKCTSCSFWYTLNSDQTGCDKKPVWWFILLIILFVISITIFIVAITIYLVNKYLNHRKLKKLETEVTIFDMKQTDVQFQPTSNQDVVINKDEILFNDESEGIKVNEETRDLICVGNTSKHTIKVQFSVKDGCDKYEIRTNPQLISIPKGKAIEFEIFIKPLCTCKINDQIMLISVDLTKGKTITTPIQVNTITIMTTRLDYSELIEDKKLGEGSFGIVYKGTFRGNQVAIKKLKQSNDNEKSMEEFNKEVSMLDKFRNDYIVHFYGAVFIPNKICMVTELAQYGSLNDLINKRKKKQINDTMKIKILLDCSKGIQYLHSNGILHRDIKPDNFLILSLENDVQVNAKLTDFGTSRNINSLMTNMTFTKGIGSPVYMAPEVLSRQKYEESSDIYSFAITIYETMIWDYAYDSTKFVYPWDIAKFVTNGKRLSKPDSMNDITYSLIDNCWKHEPKERYTIEEVIKKLEEMK